MFLAKVKGCWKRSGLSRGKGPSVTSLVGRVKGIVLSWGQSGTNVIDRGERSFLAVVKAQRDVGVNGRRATSVRSHSFLAFIDIF